MERKGEKERSLLSYSLRFLVQVAPLSIAICTHHSVTNNQKAKLGFFHTVLNFVLVQELVPVCSLLLPFLYPPLSDMNQHTIINQFASIIDKLHMKPRVWQHSFQRGKKREQTFIFSVSSQACTELIVNNKK